MIKLTRKKKLLIYKILLFVFAFVIAFMPSAASRNRELNSRVIVEMLGIDGGEDKVEVTAQYVMPAETEGATTKSKLTVSADTLPQAVELISTALGRRAELGHCSIVLLGEDVSPDSVKTLISATDVIADSYIVAADKKASDLVGDITEFMKKTGATDADFIAYGAKKAHIATNTLLGFLSDLGSASHTAFIPVIEVQEDGGSKGSGGGESSGSGGESGGSGGESGGSSGGESGGSGGGESSGSGGEKTGMEVKKLALYDENGRVGTLESDAARGVAWASAPVTNSVLSAELDVDGETEKIMGRLIKKKVTTDIDTENGSAYIKVKATIDPRCERFNEFKSDNPDGDTAVRAAFSEAIKKELEKGFNDAREFGSDPMFVMRRFYRTAPDYIDGKSITDINVEFSVDVELK